VQGIPSFVPKEVYQRWNTYYLNVYAPRLVHADGRDSVSTCLLDPRSYLRAPLLDDPYYARFLSVTGGRVLDIGCGDGTWSSPLAEMGNEIFNVDTSLLALLRLAERKRPNMHPVLADALSLPFPDNFFDAALCIFVIEHLPRSAGILLLSEARRVLRPGASMILSTDSKFYYRVARPVLELLRQHRLRKDDPTHLNLMTPGEVRRLIQESGLYIEEEELCYIGQRMRAAMPRRMSEIFLTNLIIEKCKATK